MKNANYSKLNQDGMIPVGTPVSSGDVILGKIIHFTEGNRTQQCSSTVYTGHAGVIDQVTRVPVDGGYDIVYVKVRIDMIPTVGDKFNNRHGQKGVCGKVIPERDMPFTANGMRPDIIINPHAIPSRMTVGMLLEMLYGKYAVLRGKRFDGTVFDFDSQDTDPMVERASRLIQELATENGQEGMLPMGCEKMYNGFTGELLADEVFVGPVYLQRLKHIVADKIHFRATGSRTGLTHQPPEGRQKNGGLRIGDMEKDCFIAHGTADCVHELMLDSDSHVCKICQRCGIFANKKRGRDVWYCMNCQSTDIANVKMPYSFKLLTEELKAAGIGLEFSVGE